MRTAIDIPDTILRRLQSQAVLERCSVNDLILKSVKAALQSHDKEFGHKISLPLIRSKRSGSVRLSNAKIFRVVDLP
jgi:hypothetical protein